jgi:hypothetical protein
MCGLRPANAAARQRRIDRSWRNGCFGAPNGNKQTFVREDCQRRNRVIARPSSGGVTGDMHINRHVATMTKLGRVQSASFQSSSAYERPSARLVTTCKRATITRIPPDVATIDLIDASRPIDKILTDPVSSTMAPTDANTDSTRFVR